MTHRVQPPHGISFPAGRDVPARFTTGHRR